MPHAIAALEHNTEGPDHHDQVDLQLLLKNKLQGVPPNHIPAVTLADILDQTPQALNLPNIPPDIQLPFFLYNRATIDRYASRPIKDEEKQSMEITRAIWFYRLDQTHHFQRFHDIMRWNTAIFVALLAQHSQSSDQRQSSHGGTGAVDRRRRTIDSYRPGRVTTTTATITHAPIPPAAIRFIKQYLAAVIEHHNTPTSSFAARESFILTWKTGPWELFTVFGGAQKKLLKNAMKKLSKDWEAELRVAESQLGRERYERKVGKFVGGVVPGKREMGVRAEEGKSEGGNVDMANLVLPERVEGEGEDDSGNRLLQALLAPYVPQINEARGQDGKGVKSGATEVEGTLVTDVRSAIAALQTMEPRDILPVLIRLFPA
ncbi:uncharacterized protein J4E78_006055 [Alternaria triticimaculans]|uniref:uncharacterized protein n=1 Tax=Alternaria triticimaculans TaxID=297637 RepID=UPI0020C452E1|nr:uncharacterized protein J4E78_006055 [Alternaria triticimaculans]KAI4657667.1 hypothetical protein J4E78_006055 [Alternaria triticimaculans]